MARETVMNAVVDRAGLTIGDNGLWEPHKAVASQTVYRRDRLGIDPETLTVKGDSAGHPFGRFGLVGRTSARPTIGRRLHVCGWRHGSGRSV